MERLAPGMLFVYLLQAVLLTVPVSLILIWRYRRAVAKSMALAGSSDFGAAFSYNPPSTAAQHFANHSRPQQRLILIYLLAAFSAAAFWTLLLFRSDGIEFTPLRAFSVTYAYVWPIIPTLIALLALDRRRSLGLLTGYVALGVLIVVAWSAVSRPASAWSNGWQVARLIALYASVPGLLLWIMANRRIRGVFPLVLAALLVFAFGSACVIELFARLADYGSFRRLLLLYSANTWNLWFMLAAVPVGYFCWRVLILLNRGFQKKSFSDMQFLADSFWVIVTFAVAADLMTSIGWKGLWALAGFIVYRAAIAVGFRLWPISPAPGISLLVLRVFGFERRTEKLFDSVVLRWRFRGPVRMIAGTDLAAKTIDPDDSLAFATGDLPARFVKNAEDLQERLSQLDEKRDPDGHFRVTEFFCQANTWTHALVALLARSDIVLMDLRGFNKNKSGCLFELEQLKRYARLAQTVFVVNSKTDLELFHGAVSQSSNAPQMHLQRVETDSIAARNRVYRELHSLH